MGFLRPKIKQEAPVSAPSTVSSPTELFQSMARLRRARGGRNSFAASQTSTAAGAAPDGAKPNTMTGVSV